MSGCEPYPSSAKSAPPAIRKPGRENHGADLSFMYGVEWQIEEDCIICADFDTTVARQVIRRRVEAILYVDDPLGGQRFSHRRVDCLPISQPGIKFVRHHDRADCTAELATRAGIRDKTGALANRYCEVAGPALDVLQLGERNDLDVFITRQRLE